MYFITSHQRDQRGWVMCKKWGVSLTGAAWCPCLSALWQTAEGRWCPDQTGHILTPVNTHGHAHREVGGQLVYELISGSRNSVAYYLNNQSFQSIHHDGGLKQHKVLCFYLGQILCVYLPYWLSRCVLQRRSVKVEHSLKSDCKKKNKKTSSVPPARRNTAFTCYWAYIAY